MAGEWSFLPFPFGALPGPIDLQLDPWPPDLSYSALSSGRISCFLAYLPVSWRPEGECLSDSRRRPKVEILEKCDLEP